MTLYERYKALPEAERERILATMGGRTQEEIEDEVEEAITGTHADVVLPWGSSVEAGRALRLLEPGSFKSNVNVYLGDYEWITPLYYPNDDLEEAVADAERRLTGENP